ncbi:hypothetical protein VTK56DRAFT_8873 [Thermocarpiscus australiensis]
MRLFVENYKKRDFNRIWLDLCRDDPGVKIVIRSYFRDYVENSRVLRPVLGEQEYELVQTITSDISNWIRKDLASKFGLMRESELTFVKTETTAEDLLILLISLWTRPDDVPCQPQVRVSVDFALELLGFGFRPGEVMNVRFEHVCLVVVRDPDNPDRTTLGLHGTAGVGRSGATWHRGLPCGGLLANRAISPNEFWNGGLRRLLVL